MNILLHNRLEVSNGKDKYLFYNTMLESVLTEIRQKQSYNGCIAIGTGNDDSYVTTNYKLANYLKTYKLELEFLQDDLDKGNLYVKKTVIIEDKFLDGKLITEAGITNSLENNPTIFNYFKLLNNNTLGITKQRGQPLVISVYIFLGISKSPTYYGLLTSGKNKFVDFLLGNGLDGEIYCKRGDLLSNNSSMINRKKNRKTKYPCEMEIELENREIAITFVGNLGTGFASEVLMLVGDEPFARILTLNGNDTTLCNENFLVNTNKVMDIGENVSEVISVRNNTTQTLEQNYIVKKFANKLGDEVSVPFNNLFDSTTPRFVSKDGKMIFFAIDEKVYGYKNENFGLIELDTSVINVQNIVNIFSFDSFLFIITKKTPYILAYKLEDNIFNICQIDFLNFDKYNIISNIFKCDMTYTNNNDLMFSVIDNSNHYGWTFYFGYSNGQFNYDSYICSQYNYNYVISMIKSEYSDAFSVFLKGDSLPYLCKIAYHYSDKTINDLYTTLAYDLTNDTKEIYTAKNSIVVEKLSTQNVEYYLYPNIQKVELEFDYDIVDNYISKNLKYLIQKLDDGSYKIFNLIGYDEPNAFDETEPNFVINEKILDFEILNDIVLIFLDNENNKIVALSFYENCTSIENVSSNSDGYNVTYNKFNIVGTNNKQVVANFMMRMMV